MANPSAASERFGEHIEQLTTLAKAKGFLGREFLTWLWYVADTTKAPIKVSPLTTDGGDKTFSVDLWVDDRMVLESTAAMAHQSNMKGGDPSKSREADVALKSGKTVRELKLGMNVKGIGEFTAMLGADDLNPRGLKLPNPDKPENLADPDDLPLVTRLKYTEAFLAVLDGLFGEFLGHRTNKKWDDGKGELAAIRDWIKERQSRTDTLH
jgi:hypothetical protein